MTRKVFLRQMDRQGRTRLCLSFIGEERSKNAKKKKTMKKNKIVSTGLVALGLLLSGCNDFLNVKTT